MGPGSAAGFRRRRRPALQSSCAGWGVRRHHDGTASQFRVVTYGGQFGRVLDAVRILVLVVVLVTLPFANPELGAGA